MKIACIMMQKNEKELLGIWIEYHASLFGYENLYIFDNGSDNDVKTKLRAYAKKGVKVSFNFSTPKDFENKGQIIGETIKKLDTTSDYDFYFPLDCDEFLATVNKDGVVSCDKDDILFELTGHINSKDALYLSYQLSNSAKKMSFFQKDFTRKSFFVKNTINFLDKGFHGGESINKSKHKTNIVHFHFHYKPFELVLESARLKLNNRVNVNDLEALRNYKGDGYHLKSYFFMNESDYISGFDVSHKELIPCFYYYLKSLNINYPFLDYFNSLDVDYEYTNGHIDDAEIKDNKIFVKGWCKDNSTVSYKLGFGDIILNPIQVEKYDRVDVRKIHSNYDAYVGFLLVFDIDSLDIDITKLSFCVVMGDNKFKFKNSQKLQDAISEFKNK